MTHEYLRAVETYGLSYPDLKRMARASLEHSFLPGKGISFGANSRGRIFPCPVRLHSGMAESACTQTQDASERTRVQWQLEKAFADFEKKF
jgi:hypothetical protein